MMEMHDLSKAFDGRAAIEDLSLTVEDDEYLTLLGPSGSGKSTLLRLIAGLEQPESGQISLNGEDITHRPTHMRELGFVQQNYALFPHMSVEDNVGFGLRYRLASPVTDDAEIRRRVGEILELVGLSGLGGRMVGQISGGQKQRVSLARTLVTQPKVCLLDEPLGALDANLRERMTVELRNIRKTLGVTFFHVTGNESEALAMGDRMIVLDEGRAIQIDPPDVIFDTPATIRVARFLNSYNVLPGQVDGGIFHHGEARLPLPSWASHARSIAVRFDAVNVEDGDTQPGAGRVFMHGNYVASEFMGSKVVYFFRASDGDLFEVERHLSRSDPEFYRSGDRKCLTWGVEDSLYFDAAGNRIEPEQQRGAA